MKNNKTQQLSSIIRIKGHEFNIDLDGFVSTHESGFLGHIEDCMDFASLIHDISDLFFDQREI